VSQRPLPPDLNGLCRGDDTGSEIFINAAKPKVLKHLTLFHELIHIAEEKLVIGRLIHRRSGEERVRHVATTLFGMIAMSGLWRGISPREAARFYARMALPGVLGPQSGNEPSQTGRDRPGKGGVALTETQLNSVADGLPGQGLGPSGAVEVFAVLAPLSPRTGNDSSPVWKESWFQRL
jgi:hypothetical protein